MSTSLDFLICSSCLSATVSSAPSFMLASPSSESLVSCRATIQLSFHSKSCIVKSTKSTFLTAASSTMFLENRFHVLVKRLGMKTCPALRARFSNELHSLARLRHRHLVQLRGWCTEHGEMLVVYDYSSGSLLSHHLFHHKNSVLPWHHHYNIVKSLASAILYLHEEWDEQVIHRNITLAAVFLEPNMNPRLGCFALAEFLTRNAEGHHVSSSSSARGIFGYMSPEYMESGEATTMADVYSFGVVVLEVVSGMMAVDFRSQHFQRSFLSLQLV